MDECARLKICIRGAVQGVGFRPFVYRLAGNLYLNGWVNNTPEGVHIEVEGAEKALREFLDRLNAEKPVHARLYSVDHVWLDPAGYDGFEIRPSAAGASGAVVLPDIATCEDCVAELFDPNNRRFRYPFLNCTNCGPRYSIIEDVPYDRANTTMNSFEMCGDCRAEYNDPADRRFHAQPNACPVCGPRLELREPSGALSSAGDAALKDAVDAIRAGCVIALKGLGGFQLVADAHNNEAVQRLRQRKHREHKPFAVMAPSMDAVAVFCELSNTERRILRSPETPITLLKKGLTRRAFMAEFGTRRFHEQIADAVAPENPYLGVMLPYTPLHHLLMSDLGFFIVATSGNISDEPMCIDDVEALERLKGVADLFLVHNRPIARQVDDSIVREVRGRRVLLRRSRGFAPLPVYLPQGLPPLLAVGGHLKNTVAVSSENRVILSQHIGDLDTAESLHAFDKVITDIQALYRVRPEKIVHDAHPDYASTRYAESSGLPTVSVQHHVAHALSVIAENELEPPLLAAVWDGTGYGADATVWGGEFFQIRGNSIRRIAALRRFPLPGGEAAVREPRRTALGILFELLGHKTFELKDCPTLDAFSGVELNALETMLNKNINCPQTSSMGRLFDAVASLTGLEQHNLFEGGAAMRLEFIACETVASRRYRFCAKMDKQKQNRVGIDAADPIIVIDWAPVVEGILKDTQARIPVDAIAAGFHEALAEVVLEIARRTGEERVVVSGGCFQNRLLSEGVAGVLEEAGFKCYGHQRIPPNDGGLALGQIIAAANNFILS
ncbi:MAG: carbamoyltransferase HypF [Verrucomicrobia bacterium]|nr:carbamoyltransferase HypF [Verrucomicrobiota bacterium]